MPSIPSGYQSLGSSSTSAKHSTTTYRTSKSQDTVRHELTDAVAGGFGPYGTVNYAGKSLNARLVSLDSTTEGYKSDYENASTFDGTGAGGSSAMQGAGYADAAVSEELLAASTLTVQYAVDFAAPVTVVETFNGATCTIDLCPYTSDYIVPGSVRFSWMGHIYEDYDGVLVRDRTTGDPGFNAGIVRYAEGVAEVADYVVNGDPVSTFELQSLWTVRQNWTTASIFMRTQAAPVKPAGFAMNLSDTQGNAITAQGDINGTLTGPHLRGQIDYDTGVVELQFGDYVLDTSLTPAQKSEWWYRLEDVGAVQADKIWRPWPVDPTTLRYNSVTFFYLPLDAARLGLDPVRLPPDGRVVIFRPGEFAVVGHTGRIEGVTVANGQTLNCARTRLSRVRVLDAGGVALHTGYSVNLEAGLVTFSDTAGYAQPITLEHRIEDLAQISDVQINGTLTFTRQLTHDYPLGSYVSSALVANDLSARVSALYDQGTWNGVTWQDALDGDAATATYNDTLAPVQVTNAGAVTERWALRFTNSTAFQVIGEHVGVIATGTINTDCAPINPATGSPYFELAALGWGVGWAVGNVLRLNTVGAMFPLWALRTVQQGPEAGTDYAFTLLTRGDVNRP